MYLRLVVYELAQESIISAVLTNKKSRSKSS